jgi:hypothetical protein
MNVQFTPHTETRLFINDVHAPNSIGGLLFILSTDHEGELELKWATNPEEVVEAAIACADIQMAHDNTGNTWSGKHILHFIKSVPITRRQYNGIGILR